MKPHLAAAAKARHDDATDRANRAITQLSSRRQAINFRSVAREAKVSTDFLYRSPKLRAAIMARRQLPYRQMAEPESPPTGSSAIRALSAKLKAEREAHQRDTAELRNALARAQGENLELRRRLERLGG
jgi:hypothetical protein